jgi:hypothetical protein
MIDANAIRPSGIKRKLIRCPDFSITTAGNYLCASFPRGATIRGIWFTPTTALTVADEVLDIGITTSGDTIIDGKVIPYASSAVGTPVEVFAVKGTNGGLAVLPELTSVFCTPSGASTAGAGYLTIEYEDTNN